MAKKKIMYVDDEEDLRILVSAILSKEGYDVTLAADGKECLEKLKKAKPDLIIIDMMMPGMSGRELLEKLRADKKLKSLKAVFLTVARFSEAGVNSLKKLNVLDYITKPFDNNDLLKRIKKLAG